MSRRKGPRPLIRFALTGLLAVIIAVVGAIVLLEPRVIAQERSDAREDAEVIARAVVEPVLLTHEPTPELLNALEKQLASAVINDEVSGVVVLDRSGRMVVSAGHAHVASKQRLGARDQRVLATGVTEVDFEKVAHDDSSADDHGEESSYVVRTRVATRKGEPLLVQTISHHDHGVHRLSPTRLLAPIAVALALLWLVQLPLASFLVRSLEENRRERETLLVDAVNSATDERHRIATTLHDGVLQDLAAVQRKLEHTGSPEADSVANITSQLRSTLSDVLDRSSFARHGAIELDCFADLEKFRRELAEEGRELVVDCTEIGAVSPRIRSALSGLVHEAVRNAATHANPRHISVVARRDGERIIVRITDDGTGLCPQKRAERERRGFGGLGLHTAAVERTGGTVRIDTAPGEGTSVVAELPALVS